MDIAKLLNDKREEILEIAAKHGAHNVRVFGSVVRGKADYKSDVDFLVKIEPERSLFEWVRLIDDLENLLGMRVDVVEEEALKSPIRERIIKEAVSL